MIEAVPNERSERASLSSGGAVPCWHVAETKRSKERLTQVGLEQAGIRTYLPMLVLWPRPAVGGTVAPMFPGYLFAQLTVADFRAAGRTPGVRGFVSFGGLPASLDASAIDFLRRREGPDGIIRVDGLLPASEVVIVHGPLRGMTAVVEQRLTARQRVAVLLEILQRQTRVELPDRWVRKA